MVNWAIVGSGPVAEKFVLGLKTLSGEAKICSVSSRNIENAMSFGKRFSLPVASSFEAAIQEAEVDAVYIATPPVAHEVLALTAIAAGKAVLIEKPIALDAAAALRIKQAADAAGVFCMEAMWTRFMPLIFKVKAMIDNGDIGEIRSLSGSFGISNSPEANASLFDPQAGGGALMHRGLYPVSLARMFLGPVTDVQANARLGSTGVDEDCALILTHENQTLSTISASLRALSKNDLVITGTHGRIIMAAPIFRPYKARIVTVTPRQGMPRHQKLGRLRESALAQGLAQRLGGVRSTGQKIIAPYAGNGYHYQADMVAQCLKRQEHSCVVMPMAQSVEVMRIIDAARAEFTDRN